MSGRLEGKRVVITGAAANIGKATALLFAAEGASLVVGDIDASLHFYVEVLGLELVEKLDIPADATAALAGFMVMCPRLGDAIVGRATRVRDDATRQA